MPVTSSRHLKYSFSAVPKKLFGHLIFFHAFKWSCSVRLRLRPSFLPSLCPHSQDGIHILPPRTMPEKWPVVSSSTISPASLDTCTGILRDLPGFFQLILHIWPYAALPNSSRVLTSHHSLLKDLQSLPSPTELRATFSVWSFRTAQCGFPAIPLAHSQPILSVPAGLEYHWYSHQGPPSSFVSSVPEIPFLLPPAQVLASWSTPQTCWNLPSFNYPFLQKVSLYGNKSGKWISITRLHE